MKVVISTAVLLVAISPFAFAQSDLQRAMQVFRTLREELTSIDKKSDILFLLDTHGSLSDYHFDTEKKFVINFLSTITVSSQDARVAVIPFGSTASLYVDGVSNPSLDKNKCDLMPKLEHMPFRYAPVRNTKSAFQLAYDVCVGQYSANKRDPLNQARTVVILVTAGSWNWPSHDSDPTPIAQSLLAANVEVFAIGVAYANLNLPALQQLVKDPAKQAFLLNDFGELRHLSFLVRGGK